MPRLLTLFVLILLAGACSEAPPPDTKNDVKVQLGLTGSQLVSGDPLIQAIRGDVLSLTVTSDVAEELHVHGYDKHLELKPDKAATLRFKLGRAGRFEIELHRAEKAIAVLEVRPGGY